MSTNPRICRLSRHGIDGPGLKRSRAVAPTFQIGSARRLRWGISPQAERHRYWSRHPGQKRYLLLWTVGLSEPRSREGLRLQSGTAGFAAQVSSSQANTVLIGENKGDDFGATVAIGDINGDGVQDVAVGSNTYRDCMLLNQFAQDPNCKGRAYIFQSSTAGLAQRLLPLRTQPAFWMPVVIPVISVAHWPSRTSAAADFRT